MSERYLNPSEVATMLGVSKNSIRRLCDSGKLRSVKPTPSGKHFKIPESAVREFLEKSQTVKSDESHDTIEVKIPKKTKKIVPLKLTEAYPIFGRIGMKD